MSRPGVVEKEKVHFNLAWLKKGGQTFEIVIDPDLVVKYKEGAKDVAVKDCLRSQHVYSDAKKGLQAQREFFKTIFATEDELAIATIILNEGEIQFTQEYREQLRQNKLNKIITLIQRNAIDPKTKLPIPRSRIENAIEQLKLKIKEFETAEQQVDNYVKKMMPLFPIRLEQVVVEVKIPSSHAHQSYSILKKYGELKKDVWGPSGELIAHVLIPAGVQEDLAHDLNKLCHSTIEFRIMKEQ